MATDTEVVVVASPNLTALSQEQISSVIQKVPSRYKSKAFSLLKKILAVENSGIAISKSGQLFINNLAIPGSVIGDLLLVNFNFQ